MKKALPLLLISFFIVASYQACQKASPGLSAASSSAPLTFEMQGGVDGGGGKGVQCGQQVMTLDLFEAKQNGLSFVNSRSTLEDNLIFFGIQLARHFAENRSDFSTDPIEPSVATVLLETLQREILGKFEDIPRDHYLPSTQDATIPILPSGCAMVQIVIYHKDGTLYRDRNLWDRLSLNDQTALILHEWIYYRARTYGALNSDESRKLVGQIFSGTEQPLFEPLWGKSRRLLCLAGIQGSDQEIFEFLVVDDTQQNINGLHFAFKALKNQYVTSRTSGFLTGASTADLTNLNLKTASFPVTNQETGEVWRVEIKQGDAGEKRLLLRATKVGGAANPAYSQMICDWI